MMIAKTDNYVIETKSLQFQTILSKSLSFLELKFLSIKHYKAAQAKKLNQCCTEPVKEKNKEFNRWDLL